MSRLKPRYASTIGLALILLLSMGMPAGVRASDAESEGPRMVMIIRHAEKPDETDGAKNPDLSEQGYKRADALATVIPDHFPRPDFLIATKKSKGSARPIETITPLAKAIHEPIESDFKDDEFAKVAQEVLTDPKYTGKVVLIAWHHGKIPQLAKALGATDAPDKWDPRIFDRVWEITYVHGVASLKNLPQKALPGDEQQ